MDCEEISAFCITIKLSLLIKRSTYESIATPKGISFKLSKKMSKKLNQNNILNDMKME